MKSCYLDAIHASLMACGIAVLATSCSHVSLSDTATEKNASKTKRPSLHQRIAQVSFGRDAQYVVCAEPACPKVTPKSAATVQATQIVPPALPVSAPVIAPANAPKERRIAPTPATSRLTVHFAAGAFTLDEQGKRALDDALPAARKSRRIVVMGRTDSDGSARTNTLLARQRAQAVRNYLRRGLADTAHTIVIDARGACCFVSDNDTAEGRRANRRVDVEFNHAG